jgi:hypothetical protein
MKKIVINTDYGGFGLSDQALAEYEKRTGAQFVYENDIARDDPELIAVIEFLGVQACNGAHSKLKIVEIPEDVEWIIQDYDGQEWIAEKHRTWK